MNAVDQNERYQILVKGNLLAKRYARQIMGRRKLGKFLNILFSPWKAESLGVSQEQANQILAIPEEDRQTICATQEVTHEICMQFRRLAIRIARRFAKGVGKNSSADVSQMESEAHVGLLKAIRGYSNLTVKFITYAHKSISNEVSRYLQRNMGGLSGVNSTLLVKYKKELENLTKASKPNSFEDVCASLKLTDKQISRVKFSLRAEIAYESDMEESLARILLDDKKDEKVDAELINQLESASLTMLEMHAWISQSEDIRSLFPNSFESLKEVATHYNVTPQAASEAVKRARKKLSAVVRQDWGTH